MIDFAEFCKNVHQDSVFREKSSEAVDVIAGLIHKLNTDETMYRKLRIVKENFGKFRLHGEGVQFTNDLLREFEADGIHLEAKLKTQLNALQVNYTCTL